MAKIKNRGRGNPKRGQKYVDPVKLDESDPLGMPALRNEYLSWMLVHGYSPATVNRRGQHLETYLFWCIERELNRPEQVSMSILERYQRHLYNRKKANGQRITFKTQAQHVCSIQQYFRWLCRQKYIPSNPASELELPKVEKRLPRKMLTEEEAEQVLNVPDITEPKGLRDRAMMEVFYSTGIRRGEMANLRIDDLIAERGLLLVREGKGKKDRMVPIGGRAIVWTQKYIERVRSKLSCTLSDHRLFLTEYGEPILPKHLGNVMRHYIEKADIGKTGGCHIFRHTMATLMLENGADIRYIQRMLGHAELSTTEIYTHVSIQKLKQVHELTHPAKMPEPSSF